MAIKTIEVYETEDGKTFDTLEEAEINQARIEFYDMLAEEVDGDIDEHEHLHINTPGELLKFLEECSLKTRQFVIGHLTKVNADETSKTIRGFKDTQGNAS